jgi:hypothetical protein
MSIVPEHISHATSAEIERLAQIKRTPHAAHASDSDTITLEHEEASEPAKPRLATIFREPIDTETKTVSHGFPFVSPHRARGDRRSGWYSDEFVDTAHDLALLGKTDLEIAQVFGVDERTIQRWMSKPKFRRAVMAGRAPADGKVAKSLFQRAIGYEQEATKVFMPPGADAPVYAKYVERIPPDTAAASLWLRNRQPHLWRDKHDVAVSGTLTLEHLVANSMKLEETEPPALEGPKDVTGDVTE